MKRQKENKVPEIELRWKALDEASVSPRTRLEEILRDMRVKWREIIGKEFNLIKTHFVIASGNYSYFFLLPRGIRHVVENHKFLNFHFKMIQLSDSVDFAKELGVDILLTSRYLYKKDFFKSDKLAGKKISYKAGRKYISDSIFFAASKGAIAEFGGDERKTLKEHNLLFARAFSDSSLKKQVPSYYSTKPLGRENDPFKLESDLYFFSYLLMKYDFGIWFALSSMSKIDSDNLVRLEGPIQKQERFVAWLDDKDKNIAEKLLKFLKGS